MEKGTVASEKPTRAPRATGLDEGRRTSPGRRGALERHASGHNQGTQTGYKQWEHIDTHTPAPQLGVAGRSRNPSPHRTP